MRHTHELCPNCGAQRPATLRYCGGCGRDFGVAAMSDSTALAAEPAVEPPRLDPSADESPPTVTVRATGPVVAPSPVPPVPPRPVYKPPRERRGRRGARGFCGGDRAARCGGGTFALVEATGKQQAAQPAGHAPSLTARTTAQPTQPASTQPASPQVSASPSASVSASRSASAPPPSPSVVSVAPGVSASPQVEWILTHYSQGINNRNYAEYASSLTAQGKADQPESSFDSGYATTTDSGMTLTSLTPTADGDLTATVTFTSRQSPSDSVDDSTCDKLDRQPLSQSRMAPVPDPLTGTSVKLHGLLASCRSLLDHCEVPQHRISRQGQQCRQQRHQQRHSRGWCRLMGLGPLMLSAAPCWSSATSASLPPGTPGRKKTSAAPPGACPPEPGAGAAKPSPAWLPDHPDPAPPRRALVTTAQHQQPGASTPRKQNPDPAEPHRSTPRCQTPPPGPPATRMSEAT